MKINLIATTDRFHQQLASSVGQLRKPFCVSISKHFVNCSFWVRRNFVKSKFPCNNFIQHLRDVSGGGSGRFVADHVRSCTHTDNRNALCLVRDYFSHNCILYVQWRTFDPFRTETLQQNESHSSKPYSDLNSSTFCSFNMEQLHRYSGCWRFQQWKSSSRIHHSGAWNALCFLLLVILKNIRLF